MIPRLSQAPSLPEIIIMTGFGDPRGAELAINSGAWDYIEKGSSVKDITLSLVPPWSTASKSSPLSGKKGWLP